MNGRQFRAALLVAILGATAPATAQDATPLPEVVEIDPSTVSDGMIVSFVNALIRVERVRTGYTTRILEAETEDERNALMAEADALAIEQVDAVVGITAGEYLGMLEAADESEELNTRITDRIDFLKSRQNK